MYSISSHIFMHLIRINKIFHVKMNTIRIRNMKNDMYIPVFLYYTLMDH